MAHPLELIPSGLFRQGATDMSHFQWRLLVEGDSWFSIGSLNLLKSANLLQSMRFSAMSAAVQSAYPGDTLRRMVDMSRDPHFEQLLLGNGSWRWSAILLSAGGNDLIDAVQTRPSAEPTRRLLRRNDEWGPESDGPQRYVNEAGWQVFRRYVQANLDHFIRLRDHKRGENGNAGRPLCMHTYAYPTPRPSGGGGGQGPWLMPAMQAYGIPLPDWPGVARVLVDRLAELMLECAADPMRYPALHVFDTRRVPIEPAKLQARHASGDWLNEIHLTQVGCDKLARPWCKAIEATIVANP